jgi:hypothetical protein
MLKLVKTSDSFQVRGNYGILVCDAKSGLVLGYDRGGDWEKDGDGYYDDIVRMDVAEWCATYKTDDIFGVHDILDFGFWDNRGMYFEPTHSFRDDLSIDRPDNGG